MADSTWLGAHELCTMNHERYLEAAPGLEPGNKGFAPPSLGHWAPPPRHPWSGKRDLNPRPSPWQGDALPLSYSRLERGPKEIKTAWKPGDLYHTVAPYPSQA